MPTVTLTLLRGLVYDCLDGNTAEFSSAQVTRAINQGLVRLNLLIGFSQATVPVGGGFTVAGQLLYQTPPGILIPLRVDIEGHPLERYSLERMARYFPSWAVDDSSTMGPTASWAAIGLKRFVVHPMDAYGGSLLEMTGIAPMTLLSGNNDEVQLDDEWVEILVDYAKLRCLLKEQNKVFVDQATSFKAALSKSRGMSIWRNATWPAYWEQKQSRPAGGFRR